MIANLLPTPVIAWPNLLVSRYSPVQAMANPLDPEPTHSTSHLLIEFGNNVVGIIVAWS